MGRVLLVVNLGSVDRGIEEIFFPFQSSVSFRIAPTSVEHTHWEWTVMFVYKFVLEKGCICEVICAVTQTLASIHISEMASLASHWHLSSSSFLSPRQVRKMQF